MIDIHKIYKRLTQAGVSQAECEALNVAPDRRMKSPRLWLWPIVATLLFLVGLIAIISLTRSGYTLPRAAEKPRQIEQYTIDTPRGPIAVTEIRSGTEFNRLLQLPDGQSIAESGHVNNWGERQIDMIGGTDSK
jgi:hypothetical protein